MKKYNHKVIERKWQKIWEQEKIWEVKNNSSSPNFYILDMFPYPSAEGLHVGHPEGYTASDIMARYLKMKGYNVLHPMGFDSFGLPAENYAIKTGAHPAKTTAKNIKKMRQQIKSLGLAYDWSREIITSDPKYYKWTQWIFIQLFKTGLAYEADAPINWCPSCKTGLANEEVIEGKCERCGTVVSKKKIKQWLVKITDQKYINRLEKDLESLDWPDSIKQLQRNWIGRSQGAEIDFQINSHQKKIKTFTTRPDTLFGATYLVLSPEHDLVNQITTDKQRHEVHTYQEKAANKSDLERTDLAKEKTGVFTGAYAINPVNENKIPIWIADYVLSTYGTGAIMAVPAHDERDYEFAKQFDIPIVEVVKSAMKNEGVFIGDGVAINSGEYDGLTTEKFKKKIIAWLEKNKIGKKAINYKLRDWLFSRQRYWGEPIPIIHCDKCGHVAVPEKDLPLKLPAIKKFEPTGTGESPLAKIKKWVNTKCPQCGGQARRETNTMPQWAGSNWYFLRYCDPHNEKKLASTEALKAWLPVDLYIGGAEHAVLHLLYARFIYKFLFDIGVVPKEVGDEPFKKLKNQGLIMGEDGVKMSKSRGNVINPDDVIKEYGADVLRLYEMFMGPFEDNKPWSTESIKGIKRFLERVWEVRLKVVKAEKPKTNNMHFYNASITSGIERFRFNTCISDMMKWSNTWKEVEKISLVEFEIFLKMLYPFAPHLAEEIWQITGHKKSLSLEIWPDYDQKKIQSKSFVMVIQVNGKLRDNIEMNFNIEEEQAIRQAQTSIKVIKYLTSKPKKIIFIKNKLINFVV